ncbi:histone deacetylase family protein [Methylogaea oryzae]|uniref:Deacetylase n=1 Tax=Methylogaea oryzae TaxID=1295382 RepID=A0A8D4VLU5_9GAMM|nr:histone deacetylase family protein [Methylogaea oryzae]BBL70190.1 deacetylase [Methylogaea oryzae]
MTTAFISHPDCRLHAMGAAHPECPERLDAVMAGLQAAGLDRLVRRYEAPLATREQLQRVHDAGYIDRVEASAPEEGLAYLDPDTAMNPHTWPAALRAAGAVVLAVDMVMAGEVDNAFCSVRPPGHHAEHAVAMGFCFFDNVAVGAAHALARHGLQRVAVVDFDVHHGNGTEDIFRNDPRVMLCSTFQHPFYPNKGADSGNDHIINVPLAAHSDGTVFRAAVERCWLPALRRFQPQLLLVSAGFDAHRDDDMAMLEWVEDDYVWITRAIKAVAAEHAGGRIVSVLEGGYDLDALGASAAAHIGELLA